MKIIIGFGVSVLGCACLLSSVLAMGEAAWGGAVLLAAAGLVLLWQGWRMVKE